MKKVLIIEDEPSYQNKLKEIVEHFGAKVYVADNSASAYQIAMEHAIDVFLVDMVLKGDKEGETSGNQFAVAIRQMPQYARATIIVITSLLDPDMVYYRQLHCFRYIEKNFDYDQVEQVIEEALSLPKLEVQKKEYLTMRNKSVSIMKKISEIAYLEKTGRKVIVHSVDGNCEVNYRSLDSFLEELDNEEFAKCKSNIIVNMCYIEMMDEVNRYIVLKDGLGRLEIGIKIKKQFLKRYDEWLNKYI